MCNINFFFLKRENVSPNHFCIAKLRVVIGKLSQSDILRYKIAVEKCLDWHLCAEKFARANLLRVRNARARSGTTAFIYYRVLRARVFSKHRSRVKSSTVQQQHPFRAGFSFFFRTRGSLMSAIVTIRAEIARR